MNETIALLQYSWTQNRRLLTALATTVVACELGVVASLFLSLPDIVSRGFFSVGMFALGFCLLVSVALFSLGGKASMLDPNTGYDTWLLRLPIESWKLAIIPAGLITAWMAAVLIVIFVKLMLFFGSDVFDPRHTLPQTIIWPLAFVAQTLACSSAAIFVCSLIWRPQRGAWQRFALLVASVPILYIGSFMNLITLEDGNAARWFPVAVTASILAYPGMIAFALSSVNLARVSAYQQQTKRRWPVAWKVPQAKPLTFSSPMAALRWHDWRRSYTARLRMAITFLSLLALFGFLPLTPALIGFSLGFLAVITIIYSLAVIEEPVKGIRSSLPSYLLASPLSTHQIASGRLQAVAITYSRSLIYFSPILLMNLAWPNSRKIAWQWWTSYEDSEFAMAPLRMIVAIYLAMFILGLGSAIRASVPSLYGREKFSLSVLASVIFMVSLPIGGFLYWFLQQTEWAQVQASLRYALSWSVNLLYAGLALKLAAAIAAIRVNSIWGMTTPAATVRVLAIWTATVIVVAALLWMLWPSAQPGLIVIAMLTILAIPITPWFLAPVAVAENRHCRV